MNDIDEFLQLYSAPMASTAEELRALVKRAAPDVVERLRPGWHLIGYDLPIGRKLSYFAWIWPQPEHNHVHVGWQTGTLMDDPEHQLQGANLKLKKVRYLTFEPGGTVDTRRVISFTREAERVARLSRGERELIALNRSEPAEIG